LEKPSQRCDYYTGMGKADKLLERVLSGRSDGNIRFEEMCGLLQRLGFSMRVKGSHHVFIREGVVDQPNLQRAGSDAKPYQVKQVRNIILKYKLELP
jgi:HicA toxin of bacterial toxin-antitoxin,